MKTKRRLIKKWWNEFGTLKGRDEYILNRLGAIRKTDGRGINIEQLLKYAYK